MYELGGPEVMTMRQIQDFAAERRSSASGRWCRCRLASRGCSRTCCSSRRSPLQLTPDQVELLRTTDNVVSDAARAEGRTLEGLGITGDTMEATAPSWLWRFRKTGQFHIKSECDTISSAFHSRDVSAEALAKAEGGNAAEEKRPQTDALVVPGKALVPRLREGMSGG